MEHCILKVELLAEPLDEEVGCRAVERVLNREMVNLVDLLAVRVRKFATGLRADRVDRAEIVRAEKRAGRFCKGER